MHYIILRAKNIDVFTIDIFEQMFYIPIEGATGNQITIYIKEI